MSRTRNHALYDTRDAKLTGTWSDISSRLTFCPDPHSSKTDNSVINNARELQDALFHMHPANRYSFALQHKKVIKTLTEMRSVLLEIMNNEECAELALALAREPDSPLQNQAHLETLLLHFRDDAIQQLLRETLASETKKQTSPAMAFAIAETKTHATQAKPVGNDKYHNYMFFNEDHHTIISTANGKTVYDPGTAVRKVL